MKFMNDCDIQVAAQRYGEHEILGPAIKTLKNLVEWTNDNSDGWAYWPKPARAARKLMELIDGDGTHLYGNRRREDVTLVAYKKALVPIKAFRTKQEASFDIEEIENGIPYCPDCDTPGADFLGCAEHI